MRPTGVISLVGLGASLAEIVVGAAVLTSSQQVTKAPPATATRSAQVVPTFPVAPPPPGKKEPKNQSSTFNYPQARREDAVENYFGTPFADPYRWMETLKSPETQKFLKEQNELADQYLGGLKVDAISKAMLATDNAKTINIPVLRGDYYYYYMRPTPFGQDNLYRSANKQLLQQSIDDIIKTSELVLDPTVLSANGISSCDTVQPSFTFDKTKYICFSKKEEADYGFLTTWDITRAPAVKIDEVRFTSAYSSISHNDVGYAYLRQIPGPGITWENAGSMGEFLDLGATQPLFHKFGTNSSEDKRCATVVLAECAAAFGTDTRNKTTNSTAAVAGGTQLTALNGDGSSNTTTDPTTADPGGARFVIFNNGGQPTTVKLEITPPNQTERTMRFLVADEELAYFETNMVDPNLRHVFSIPLYSNNSEARIWTTLSRANHERTESAFALGNRTLALMIKGLVVHSVKILGDEGKILYEHPVPNGIISDQYALNSTFLFSYQGLAQRHTTYVWDNLSKNMNIFQKSPFDVSDQMVYSLEWATSKDGTKVPMSVVKSKKLKQDGNNPVFTYVYGGFDVRSTPAWSQHIEMIVNKFGGIYALIHARGDKLFDDEGPGWWKSAMGVNKPRTIEDALAGGQWFVDQKWSSNGRVAINGHSNGGIMTAAACLQGRNLYDACIAEYGVHDILRQRLFTNSPWYEEYGNPVNKTELEIVMTWAPLVNIKPGTQYPPFYIETGDRDTNVHPMHSFKLAATLQHATQNVSDARPVIFRINEVSGHNPTVAYHDRELWARRLAFWAEHVGATFQN
ncbi:Alpha/Beta hydrolase protein [Phlyctochytrium arcticum]|nr:Alpha/Beta hydrolase protein [Phlyctochytrium arcticum]